MWGFATTPRVHEVLPELELEQLREAQRAAYRRGWWEFHEWDD